MRANTKEEFEMHIFPEMVKMSSLAGKELKE